MRGRSRKVQKIIFEGVGEKFVANRIEMGKGTKRQRFLDLGFTPPPNVKLALNVVNGFAVGRLGKAYDLVAYRGKQKIRLVVKKYGDRKNQSSIAEEEFGLFKRLRQKGYSVPPKIMLVGIKGKKYLALTDWLEFGDVIAKRKEYAEKVVGKKQMDTVLEHVREETERAKKLEGLDISKSWRYVINTKNKTVRAFILSSGSIIRA